MVAGAAYMPRACVSQRTRPEKHVLRSPLNGHASAPACSPQRVQLRKHVLCMPPNRHASACDRVFLTVYAAGKACPAFAAERAYLSARPAGGIYAAPTDETGYGFLRLRRTAYRIFEKTLRLHRTGGALFFVFVNHPFPIRSRGRSRRPPQTPSGQRRCALHLRTPCGRPRGRSQNPRWYRHPPAKAPARGRRRQ